LSTEAKDTNVSVPELSAGAGASFNGFVVELTSGAVDNAEESVESLATRAFTLVGNVAVYFSTGTYDTDETVPSGGDRTFTRLSVDVPGPAVGTYNTGVLIPELACRTYTSLGSNIPNSSSVTPINTLSAIPPL
jgi:hypothetical protein